MRSVLLIIFFVAASFCDLDFYTKTRIFSNELFYQTVQNTEGNVVISPYAIWYLLISIAYETLGITREQLTKVFLLTDKRNDVVEGCKNLSASVLETGDVYITMLNFLFYDENLDINTDSVSRLENDFGFITRRLNFENSENAADNAVRTFKEYGMSMWSEDTVAIQDFVDSKMIMCNYFVFEAKWAYPFNVSNIINFKAGNRTRYAEMWYTKARLRSSNFDSLKATVTELPYEGEGRYCMLLIQPNNNYSINEVIKNLRYISLKEIFAKLQSDVDEFGIKEIQLKLPLYFNDTPIIMNNPLIHMGLSDIFSKNDANFDSISKDKLYISQIVQKVWISIEKTKTIIRTTTPGYNYGDRPKRPAAMNDPFIFYIAEKSTETVLFAGTQFNFKNIYL